MNKTTVSTPIALALAACLACPLAACSRGTPAQPAVTPAPESQGNAADTSAAHANPAGSAANTGAGAGTGSGSGTGAGTGGTAAVAPTPAGPRAEITGDHYALTAALTAPPAVPGESTLTVELRATGGYHVNELYPIALDLTATNATTRPQLRRADATSLTQQLGAFRVPVQVTGAGASVTGNLRFAVCSEENCVPQQRSFAVNLP